MLQKIKDIEEEMGRTQRNKATEHHLGMLKAKLAKLRAQLLEGPAQGGASSSQNDGWNIQKQGDARVALIGFPSVGKSTILNKLTHSEHSVAAAYEFTTLTCVPGVIQYKGATIQLCDLPGIIEGAAKGRGRGRQVIAVARTADLILMMLDANKGLEQKRLLTAELESVGIRLNKTRPDISFVRKKTGGLKINATVPQTRMDDRLVRNILHEYKIHNAEILFRIDASVDDFIDIIEGNRSYLPCLYCFNKIDTITMEAVDWLARRPHSVVICAEQELNLDWLLRRIWDRLALLRVYTKMRGAPPDLVEPVIVRGEPTVERFCRTIHNNILKEFKTAFVWGLSAKHNPQRVGLTHQLVDEDVVMIVKKQGKNA